MADPLAIPAAGQGAQPGECVGGVRAGEIGAADDARVRRVRGGEREERVGLLCDGEGLDENRAVHAGRAGAGFQGGEGEVAPERAAGLDPVLVPYGQVPDVVVGIHGHGRSRTTGRPSAPRPD
ncbi:hypothetical protein AQJ58_26285 [Streptomyces sp. DSM 15324]|nr:hypothetical protein AQJ58_26285 [Streptomyces sp. DSM 15324]